MEEQKKKKRLSIISIAILVLIAIALIVGMIFLFKTLFGGNKKDETDPEQAWLIDGYMALLNDENDIFTYSDQKGNTVQYVGYTDMEDFYFDTTCVAKLSEESQYKREHALITSKQKIVVDYGTYDDIDQIDDGRFYEVEKDDMYGIIDYKGKIVVPVEYDYIRENTIQDGTQYVFACEREDDEKYDYITETGKLLTTLDAYESFTYYYTLSEDAATLVEIDDKYFNTVTGEEMFAGIEDVEYKYNVLIEDEKYTLFNKDLTVKAVVECPNTTYFDVTKSGDYIMIEQTIKDEKNWNTTKKYTLYDNDMNVVKESDNEIIFYQYEDSPLYFITGENGTLTVSDVKGNVKFTAEGYKFPSGNLDDMFMYFKSKNSNNTYDLYNLEGTKVLEGLSSIAMQEGGYLEKDYMMICRRADGNLNKSILLDSMVEIPVDDSVNVIEKYKNHILTSNWSDQVVKIYNLKGEQVVDDIFGTWSNTNGKYITIQNDDYYMIYNLETATQTFKCEKSVYVDTFDSVRLIELEDGFYNYDGELVLGRNIEE